ncbi:hypothetical protein [Kitasatospora xanthocidica]|nr:hypothetical protein [Kitasatospora xanthocidica]GHF69958.1 hypothetical protein GCM10018790_54840 [Kitasatospora xanthocidica]
MESTVLELQELPETEEQPLEPMMCCDTGHHSYEWTDLCLSPVD